MQENASELRQKFWCLCIPQMSIYWDICLPFLWLRVNAVFILAMLRFGVSTFLSCRDNADGSKPLGSKIRILTESYIDFKVRLTASQCQTSRFVHWSVLYYVSLKLKAHNQVKYPCLSVFWSKRHEFFKYEMLFAIAQSSSLLLSANFDLNHVSSQIIIKKTLHWDSPLSILVSNYALKVNQILSSSKGAGFIV